MATKLTRAAAIYWGTGTAVAIAETRVITIDAGADFADDTVHGDTNRSEAPTFGKFNVSVTGLWDDSVPAAGNAAQVTADAISKTSGKFYIYPDRAVATKYWYGTGYVSVDEISLPYDDFATFNWTVRPSGTVTQNIA